jgi:hypothetical protein
MPHDGVLNQVGTERCDRLTNEEKGNLTLPANEDTITG